MSSGELPTPTPPSSTGHPTPTPRRIRSEDLLQGDLEILIEHHGETYRLRQTRSGKLILQK